jgi:D-glycero-alpha-D-manno-heptose-7-phosphate kinase
MKYYSKAPLRIGLAGGGTDVSPYCDLYGGVVLNATISLYANATIELNTTNNIVLFAADRNEKEIFAIQNSLPINGKLDLLKGVYNRLKKEYTFSTQGFTLTTFVDAPAGSGLGSSSTLVVAIIGAFVEMLKLTLTTYDIAKLAFDIERNDLQITGGKQDQYAAIFGGVNYIEFFTSGNVNVTPLKIKAEFLLELESNLLLFYTETSRESGSIIKEQQANVISKNELSINAMHQLKEQAINMKNVFLNGTVDEVGPLIDFGFNQKRKIATNISNPLIEDIYNEAKKAGATGGKISGAGGGGFMIFYCPASTRNKVMDALKKFQGAIKNYTFVEQGLSSWTLN